MADLPGSDDTPPAQILTYHVTEQPDIQESLRKFWELEEVPNARRLTAEEEYCEQHYRETHSRDAEGRYTVRLPRRRDTEAALGVSRSGAFQMLLSTERRLG